MFFQKQETTAILNHFVVEARYVKAGNERSQNYLARTLTIVNYIREDPASWDNSCQFNISHIGDKFLNALTDFNKENAKSYGYIYMYAVRFFCEFNLSGPYPADKDLLSEIEVDIPEQEEGIRSQITDSLYVMPAKIAKSSIADEDIKKAIEFGETVKAAQALENKMSATLDEKEARVEALKSKLDEQETAYNFVGLDKGFQQIEAEKESESRKLWQMLIVMGGSVLVSILIELQAIIVSQDFMLKNWTLVFPMVTLVVVLIYFFRVILMDYKSVKAQLLQIKLRRTLCQFIQGYIDYSSKLPKDDKPPLEKFENLIFSNIMADADKLPSTFDGMEQVEKFLKLLGRKE